MLVRSSSIDRPRSGIAAGYCAAAVRFLIDAAIHERYSAPFPLRIFAVNIAGALTIGLVAGGALHGEALVIVAGGGIGPFTTFSTWILDAHRLEQASLTRIAWLNIGVSLVVGFAAVALGHWLGGAL
jgi:CrcB protein